MHHFYSALSEGKGLRQQRLLDRHFSVLVANSGERAISACGTFDTDLGNNQMPTKYGFDVADWEAAKEEMRQILLDRARMRSMIAYSALVDQVTAIHFAPDSFALAHMLGEISADEDAAGRGMLTVIVVHKDGDMEPGPGFFELARNLGRDTSDKTRCWVNELHRVHREWGRGDG